MGRAHWNGPFEHFIFKLRYLIAIQVFCLFVCNWGEILKCVGYGTSVNISNTLYSDYKPHELVLKRCGIINTLTIWGREWGGGVLPSFIVARQWWIVNKDYLQTIQIQVFYCQVHASEMSVRTTKQLAPRCTENHCADRTIREIWLYNL